jgi:hypothetical protein
MIQRLATAACDDLDNIKAGARDTRRRSDQGGGILREEEKLSSAQVWARAPRNGCEISERRTVAIRHIKPASPRKRRITGSTSMPRPFYVFLAALAGTLLIAINPIGDLGIGIKAGLIWGFLAYVDYRERQHEKAGSGCL